MNMCKSMTADVSGAAMVGDGLEGSCKTNLTCSKTIHKTTMSGLRNIAKGGWHPGGGKDSGGSSSSSGGGSGWRSKINDKIPSRINDRIPGSTSKSERERIEARENHVSQPLAALRDRE